ncbi:MAG TPA: XRE family transcriptional regulator [Rhodobacteraceae bacterium]|nr:XRE family transcriptional regulator [Paracoccaceae bacterium]
MIQQNLAPCPYGATLRSWRLKRCYSQMALGLSANVSARHISFLETGRAKPSREMVLQLAAWCLGAKTGAAH